MTPSRRTGGKRKPDVKVEVFDWRGITVSISYAANWLNSAKNNPDFATSHLEIKAISPKEARLPISGTGFLSHFLAPGTVEEAGSPTAFVRAWLDEAAASRAWRRYENEIRQLSLY
jgi:hypothetical protein